MSTFDTTYALSALYLWMAFGLMTTIINCDLQRAMRLSPFLFHFVGITAFFFLFTLIDPSNTVGVHMVWLKTIFVYGMFVLMTKSKWYFTVPVLGLLLVDQTQKKQVAFIKARQEASDGDLDAYQVLSSEYINKAVIGLIVVGALHYMYLQKLHFKSKFSLYKFFLTTGGCRV
jgi:hypothetical protein